MVKILLGSKRPGFDARVGEIPWRKAWQTTPVFLPGESHGQKSLVGNSPWGPKESDTTECKHNTEHELYYTLIFSHYCHMLSGAPEN